MLIHETKGLWRRINFHKIVGGFFLVTSLCARNIVGTLGLGRMIRVVVMNASAGALCVSDSIKVLKTIVR